MVSELTTMRQAVRDALRGANLNAESYMVDRIYPPTCIVLPADPYIALPIGQNPLRQAYSVGMRVVIIGGNGLNEAAAEEIDLMIQKAVLALEDDWEITGVSEPTQLSIRGTDYVGSVITLETNTNLEGGI